MKQKYPQREKQTFIRHSVQPKSVSQEFYLDSLRTAPLTIGVGPAGSGKSFLAMATALENLLSNRISKILITRPIRETGENLGFLPGTADEKIAPYLLPLLDAMEDIVGVTHAKKLLDSGKIEFAPLAFMRGRTFSDSVAILDEAQNTTVEQIKMFCTRAGQNCKLVINGDLQQSDLGPNNGLQYLVERVRGKSSNINVIEFSTRDVVRSDLVKELLMYL